MSKKAKLLLFQQDLKDGMSIEEALKKHELTFKYACDNMPRTLTKKKKGKKNNPSKNISINKDKYLVRKNEVYYGRYETLKEAMRLRDYMEKYGWNKKELKRIQEKLGVKPR